MGSDKRKKASIISSTHWDREWYRTFEEFQKKLSEEFFPELIDLLENTDYRCFTLDGQTIMLEDYLDSIQDEPKKDQQRRRLTDLVTTGKIEVGPFYVQPDSLLISGESNIKNLELGMAQAKKWGQTGDFSGYVPDSFGHHSQMAQILDGFGIDSFIFWRGIEDSDTRKSEFRLRSPDGTEVLGIYLPGGYGNLGKLRSKIQKMRYLKDMTRFIENRSHSDNLLLIEGSDHMMPWQGLPGFLKKAKKRIKDHDIEHILLKDYVKAVKDDIDLTELSIHEGELRSEDRRSLLRGTSSTRMYLKQRQRELETLLERQCGPVAAFVNSLRFDPEIYLEYMDLWKKLAKNFPHDSICGCSIDNVHQEMMDRYTNCEWDASILLKYSTATIASKIDTIWFERKTEGITVFNTLSFKRDSVVNCETFSHESGEGIYAIDDEGNESPVKATRKGISFFAKNIPANGYKTYRIKKATAKSDSCICGKDFIENKNLRISMNNDGTFDLEDKMSGTTFSSLHRLEDRGEAGDEYDHSTPKKDLVVNPRSATWNVMKNKDYESITIEYLIEIPKALSLSKRSRSKKTIEHIVKTTLKLYEGSKRLDITTKMKNEAKDHWLRVVFPSGSPAYCSYAHMPFDIVERSTDFPEDWHNPTNCFEQQLFCKVNDLVVLNKGLPEYEATESGDIKLTLLRCTDRLSRPLKNIRPGNGHAGPWKYTPKGQCLFDHVFEYSLYPDSKHDMARVMEQALDFTTALIATPVQRHEGHLASKGSYFDCTY